MNTREFNRMNMFTAVNSVLKLFGKTIKTIGALFEAADEFDRKLALVAKRDAQYTSVISGATAAKNSAADTLIDVTLRIANALLVFGTITENEPLKAKCRLTTANLHYIRALELVRISVRIAELGKQYATELSTYGITESDLLMLTEAIDSFRTARNTQQQRFAESKSARGLLSDTFTETYCILKNQLDPLMELVKHDDIEFYTQYRAARVIRDMHGRSYKKNNPPTSPETPETAAA